MNEEFEKAISIFLSSLDKEIKEDGKIVIEVYPVEKGKMPVKLYSDLHANAYKGNYLN